MSYLSPSAVYKIKAKFKEKKHNYLLPFAKYLKTRLKLTSNKVTGVGFVFGIIATYFLFANHLFFVIFLLLFLLCDLVDGIMATLEEKDEDQRLTGWLVDAFVDRMIMLLILLKTQLFFYSTAMSFVILLYLIRVILMFYRRITKGETDFIYFSLLFYATYLLTLYEIGTYVLLLALLIDLGIIAYEWRKKPAKAGQS